MSDLLHWGASVGFAAAAAAVSAVVARTTSRAPLLARMATSENDHARELASARRRSFEATKRHESKERRLRSALGLPDSAEDVRVELGRALAESLVARLHGLASVDRCLVADAQGLAWTADDFAEGADLAASAGAALAVTLRGSLPREVHVELADARHIVVRPIPGTLPGLAVAALSTSRPISPFALDAALAHTSLLAGTDDEGTDVSPLLGFASRVSRGDTPVTMTIARELEDASPSVSSGAMALLIGDELIAAFGADGPRQEDLAPFATTLRDVLAKFESRMGSAARRIDWVAPDGAAISLAPLGASRRTLVLVVRRSGPVEGSAFDRLGGRLRRMLPADANPAPSHEARP